MNVEKGKVKAETDFNYINKFNNKELRFKPKEDEVMASFGPETDEVAAHEVMGATSMAMSQGFDLERGFAVFHVGEGQDLEAASAALIGQRNVVNTLPVMEDEEGLTRYFMPDEFTVQFTNQVSVSDCVKML